MVGSLISAGLSTMGSITQGEQADEVEKANAKTNEVNAQNAEVFAKANAQNVERATARNVADARANFSASGIDVGTGSPLEVMHAQATEGELARRLTVFQGLQQAKGFASQAAIDKAKGAAAKSAGYFQAGTTMLTALDKAAENEWPGWDS